MGITRNSHLPILHESASLRYFTFFYLYIMQGIPAGFALYTIANYLMARGIAPEQVGTFIAVVGVPWIAQFFWGPLIDRYQYSTMGRRKQWAVFSQWASITVSALLLFIDDPQKQIHPLSWIFFTHSIFASIQVASVDAIAITIAPPSERGRLNAFMRGGFLIGTAFGAAGLSLILHAFGFRYAALTETILLLGFSLLFFFTKLERKDALLPTLKARSMAIPTSLEKNPSFGRVFKKVYFGITRQKSLRYLLIVAVTYFCSSVFIRSYTYHLIHYLKWSDQTVSVLQGGWGSIITLIGILWAGIQSDRLGAKPMQIKVMWVICLFLLVLNGCSWAWKETIVSGAGLVLWNLADPALSVTVFPILMGLCLKKVEGSQFTTYLALINLCDVLGSYITGWSLHVLAAPILGLLCGVVLLLVLVFLWLNHNKFIPGSRGPLVTEPLG